MAPKGRDFRLIFAATVLNAVAGTISGLAMPLISACGIVLWVAASGRLPAVPEP